MSLWQRGKKKFSFRDLLMSSNNPVLNQSNKGNSIEEPSKDEVMTKRLQDSNKPVQHINADEIKKESTPPELKPFTSDQSLKTTSSTAQTPDTEPITNDDDTILEAPLRELFDESYSVDPLMTSLMERVDNIKAVDLAKDLQDLSRTLQGNVSDQKHQN